jgi:myo-inositol 2-dehydrogenase/D-chiro-inositol 1-dehydrogenase
MTALHLKPCIGDIAMSNIRFGLIGYGAWGSHHARAVAATPGAELVAIASRSEATREKARTEHPSAHIHADYRALLSRETLDVVDVVLPSSIHHEVGKAALESGRHLLLEKPMAVTLADCVDLVSCARRQQRVLAIGHEFRHSSLWGKAKEMVEEGAIGEPLYLLIELWRRPYRLGSQGWRYDIKQVGNWILEEPIHFFDMARWYFAGLGEPVSVYARANSRQPGHPELQDNFSAVVNFPRGAYAVISQTLAAYEHHQVVKLTGSKGALWATWGGEMDRTFHPQFSLKHHDGSTVRDIPIAKITGEVYELEDEMAMMVRAVRDGSPVACPGEDGLRSVGLCLAAQQSVERGQIVSLAEFFSAAGSEASVS